jgi:hypothetical protein
MPNKAMQEIRPSVHGQSGTVSTRFGPVKERIAQLNDSFQTLTR